MDISFSTWVLFNLFIIFLLIVDLGIFHRKTHEIRFKEAIGWSCFWIALSLIFNVFLWWMWPEDSALSRKEAGLLFFAGYLIEKSLSIDNIFVLVMLFSYFRLPLIYHHRVLIWGILGAMILRGTFIFAGVVLIEKFAWTLYIFGVFLIFTGIKLVFVKDSEINPERNLVLKFLRRFFPISQEYVGGQFFARIDGKLFITPLFVLLVIIETTDLVFAIDSIPAIFGITQDPFIIYTSNIFAILGLRSLYFAMAGIMNSFYYLNYGLAVVLVFIGTKMLIEREPLNCHIGIGLSLGVVGSILLSSVVASLIREKIVAFRPHEGVD